MSDQSVLSPPSKLVPPPSGVPRFAFSWSSVILASMMATLAITLYMLFIPRWLGMEQMDIGITVGALSDPTGGPLAFAMRVAWHVGNGLVYVFVYAGVLWWVQIQSDSVTGILFGLGLWLIGPMVSIPLGLEVFPEVASGQLTNPGVFMLALGLGWLPAIVDFGAHLTHGILTGVIYKHRLGK